MESSDRDEFQRRLTAAWSLYGKSVTPDVLGIFWSALKPWPLDDVARALNKHAASPDVGQYAPKPADLIRQIEGDTESQAMRAWAKVLEAIQRVGSYASVTFDDPLIHVVLDEMGGWIYLGETLTVDETPFRAAEFVKRYRGYASQRARPPFTPRLAGRVERHNAPLGAEVPLPILIGDPAKAQRVLEAGATRRLGITRASDLAQIEHESAA